MMLIAAALALCTLQFPETAAAAKADAGGPVASIRWRRSDLPSRRAESEIADAPPARPRMYIDAVGRRSYVAADEDGPLEAWVWPYQVLWDGRFYYQPPRAADFIDLQRRAVRVDARPESTIVEYQHPDLTGTIEMIALDDERAVVLLLRLEASAAGRLRFAFAPKLQPQWPAAIGGAAGAWKKELGGYVISEPSARCAAVVGSPWAEQGTEGMQYLLPDEPLRLEMELDPARCRGEVAPIVIALAEGDGAPGAASDAYRRVLRTLPALTAKHAADRAARCGALPSLHFDAAADAAFALACRSMAQSMIQIDSLGAGCAAGFGPAGATSQRPGFAWFFTGDVGFNAQAYTAAGLFDDLAAALRFAANHRRADGKMPHEMVLSADLCDWKKKYPFAYIHGDTSALWLHALRTHVDASGDRGLARELWVPAQETFAWMCAQDEDGDGLPDNARAGMGASETGALLRADMRTDVHLAATFAAAAADTADLARFLGDDATERRARAVADKARARIANAFFDEADGTFAHALLADGTRSPERTAWAAVPVWLGAAEKDQARRTMERLERPDLTTPWGVRILSSKSDHYDPKGYNSGAVWPFLTGIASLADFRCGRAEAGWNKLAATAGVTLRGPIGCTTEVLSGDRPVPLDTAVPRQIFSAAAVVAPAVRGLAGFEPGLMLGRVALRPCLPAGKASLAVSGLRAGKQTFDVTLVRDGAAVNAKVVIHRNGAEHAPDVVYEPRGAAGTCDVTVVP